MKYIFICCLVILTTGSIVTVMMRPSVQSHKPILYWVTDPNPTRTKQVEVFEKWLDENYGDELQHKYGFRTFELKIDSANSDLAKKVIQGVSGVGGDIMDITSSREMTYFVSMGLLKDISSGAQHFGFIQENTYPNLKTEISIDTKQYLYPAKRTVFLFSCLNFGRMMILGGILARSARTRFLGAPFMEGNGRPVPISGFLPSEVECCEKCSVV